MELPMANARISVLARQLTSAATVQQQHDIVICGGCVYDVQAIADVDLHTGGSVPGKVMHTPGGVARNIAACLSQLLPPNQLAPVFCTLLGRDVAGQALLASLQQLRLNTSFVQSVDGITTPTVLAIFDKHGEVASCVADVRSVEDHLTPSGGLSKLAQAAFPQASLLVCETNLSEASLEFLCKAAHQAGVPVILEPVSPPKSKRAVGCLPYLSWITPNAKELVAMAEEVLRQKQQALVPGPALMEDASSPGGAGSSLVPGSAFEQYLEQLASCASILLQEGTQQVLVTLGSRGAALMHFSRLTLATDTEPQLNSSGLSQSQHANSASNCNLGGSITNLAAQGRSRGGSMCAVQCIHLPALPPSGSIVSLSGAGDTLVGGLAAGLHWHRSAEKAAAPARQSTSELGAAAESPLGGKSGLPLGARPSVSLHQHQDAVDAVALGMAAATLTIQSHYNVPLDLGVNLDKLSGDAKLISSKATTYSFLSHW